MNEINKRRQELKVKFRKRQRIFAAWTSLGHPSISEIFANMGVDFIGIDIEHSTISLEQSQQIIATCQANKTLCLPRLATHNMEATKRLLDSGADGIIIPSINNAEEAKKIISWSKYPPLGNRGYGVARAQGYGFDFEEYVSKWNDVSSLVVQIESIQAVNNIGSILSLDEVDAAMIGPYDISGSLNIPGKLEHPKVQEACKHVVKACAKYHKACGTQVIDPDLKSVEAKFELGYTFVVLASDVFLLWKWSQKMQELIRKVKRVKK